VRAAWFTPHFLAGNAINATATPDIIIDIDPEAHITVFDYAEIKAHIASLLEGRVDAVRSDSLKPDLRPAASAQAVYAF
jgi:predicted nucleotidyltransferase